jgi:hypothetical protein
MKDLAEEPGLFCVYDKLQKGYERTAETAETVGMKSERLDSALNVGGSEAA